MSVRALVTNDDGIDSVGLHRLAKVAAEAGLEVVVAAPDQEYSGSSASLTALADGGKLLVHERTLDGVPVERALAVEATPGFIAFTGARGAFGGRPDLVLSGINRGPNTGSAVLHSGTVGATLTGATHGIPGLAVSLAAPDPTEWDTAEEVARRALAWLLANPQGPTVVNVNVPNVPPGELRGLHAARLAAFGAVQADVGEAGEGFVTLTFSEVPDDPEPGTDVALLRDGWATVTLLNAPCEADGDLPGLDGA
ncbi:5'/3'-nucleotidase SurE [Geodermatophilus sp. YIM 151500]|uniref:5'/3'-nucleotidase SurE n=1 Tax=Geodermatophilus sp. YIM 151500 TaxID=2984531 RepID=UPI0021E4F016|nr:5'/3'-nucleotidase SurE [Geodermatophilus sp. YIM 151500]MCV2489144.1 5'/3'-nucleotidase SurE [Geodermatophilus sp. YIM 151500]